MSKKIMIGVGIIIVAAVTYMMYSRQPSTSSPASLTSQSANETMSEAQEFAKAVESGKPTLCTLAKDGETMEYRIKGKMMRANMNISMPSKDGKPAMTKSYMINDGSYFYIWADGQKQGSKMSLTQPSPVGVSSSTPTTPRDQTPKLESQSDYDSLKSQGYTINCQAGTVSDADFVPPKDVQFIDPTEMMKQIPPTQGGRVDMEKWQQQYGFTTPADNE